MCPLTKCIISLTLVVSLLSTFTEQSKRSDPSGVNQADKSYAQLMDVFANALYKPKPEKGAESNKAAGTESTSTAEGAEEA